MTRAEMLDELKRAARNAWVGAGAAGNPQDRRISTLDSLGAVSFYLAFEQQVSEHLGIADVLKHLDGVDVASLTPDELAAFVAKELEP